MRLESLKLRQDMKEAAADLASFVDGRSLEDYLRDKQLRRAVERQFEIVGEALSQLNKADPTVAQSITDWRAIIGFRNVLIHGYGYVDSGKTWDIAQTEIPLLRRGVDELLARV